jgi:hypothetical protein
VEPVEALQVVSTITRGLLTRENASSAANLVIGRMRVRTMEGGEVEDDGDEVELISASQHGLRDECRVN